MVATVDLISEASHKHAKEVTSLAFDGEHLYSGGVDGVINVRNDYFQRNLRESYRMIYTCFLLWGCLNFCSIFVPTYFH